MKWDSLKAFVAACYRFLARPRPWCWADSGLLTLSMVIWTLTSVICGPTLCIPFTLTCVVLYHVSPRELSSCGFCEAFSQTLGLLLQRFHPPYPWVHSLVWWSDVDFTICSLNIRCMQLPGLVQIRIAVAVLLGFVCCTRFMATRSTICIMTCTRPVE